MCNVHTVCDIYTYKSVTDVTLHDRLPLLLLTVYVVLMLHVSVCPRHFIRPEGDRRAPGEHQEERPPYSQQPHLCDDQPI